MIEIDCVRWMNLLSTGNDWIEFDFRKSKTTLVVGKNGAGKTTMIEALSFGWFNKPYRKITKPELVNTITEKGLLVEVEWRSGGKKYMVRRGMKPNVFEVYENGKKWDFGGIADQQGTLERTILKMTHKSFLHIVAIGTTNYTPFLKLPTGDRRKFVDDLLDTEVFTVMNSFLKTRIDSLKKEILTLERREEVLEERLRNEERRLREIRTNDEDLIREKNEQVEQRESQAHDLELQAEQLDSEIDGLMATISDALKVRDKLSKLQKLRYPIEEKKRRVLQEKHFFETTDDCPTCKQGLTKHLKQSASGEKEAELKSIEEGLVKLDEKISECGKRLAEIQSVETMIEKFRSDSSKLKTNANFSRRIVSDLLRDIKKIEEKARSSKDAAEVDVAQTRKDLEEIRVQARSLSSQMPLYAAAGTLLKDTGIKAAVVKQYVPVINRFVNKYLADLDFFVGFEFDENFEVAIKARHRDKLSYEGFSSGEKMRIDLALLFAWRAIAKMRVSTSVNLLIFDEVLDASLDNNGTDDFMKVIQQLTSDNTTVIISHKGDQLVDKFGRVVRFAQIGNFSKMTEEK